jgi:hypothetical protein
MWYLIPEIKSRPKDTSFSNLFFSRLHSGGSNPRGTDENHAASLKGQLASIHGSDQLGFWPGGAACNRISGIDPGTLPTDIHKERSTHWLFKIVIPSFVKLGYFMLANTFDLISVAEPERWCRSGSDFLLWWGSWYSLVYANNEMPVNVCLKVQILHRNPLNFHKNRSVYLFTSLFFKKLATVCNSLWFLGIIMQIHAYQIRINK